ncbi:exodeoxyribonuclease III [Aliarcobacter cryaerophilus]|uniref:exodeoxyribonuclease III n=1 Tax=Aliarcobacter cryaerophilus TaxID=28198 RepID=UPI003DA2276E
MSWNVNGLNSIQKKKALKWIDLEDIDIICLQETKLSIINFDHSKLFKKEFLNINNNISSKKGFSGTLVYSNIQPHSINFCHNVDIEEDGRIIKYKFKNLILFNIYFPNGKLNKQRLEYKLNFYKTFLKYCMKLRENGYPIIICGDFNTAHTDLDLKSGKIYSDAGFTVFERQLFTDFLEAGFIDTFRYSNGNIKNAYTLFPYRSKAREKNEGWRIDYILITEDLKEKLKSSFILDNILGSDHLPIGIEIDLDEYI